MPSLRAAAAAMRTRFDCTAPVASTVSASLARASPKWNSSWRTLLTPKAHQLSWAHSLPSEAHPAAAAFLLGD